MNWTVQNLEDEHFVRINIEGRFAVEDHLRNIEEITLQENWKPGLNILFDCTKADFGDSSYMDVQELARNFIKNDVLVGCSKIAVLMRSVVDFGKGRQFEMLTDEQICADVCIFATEPQALRWLSS